MPSRKYQQPFLSTIGERSTNASPQVSINRSVVSQNGSVDINRAGSRTSRLSDNLNNHVAVSVRGDEESISLSGPSIDTSSSLLHLLFWTVAILCSIQISRYQTLGLSFVNATPAIISCGVWRFGGLFRVWAGITFLLATIGGYAVGNLDLFTAIVTGSVFFKFYLFYIDHLCFWNPAFFSPEFLHS
jgi:hypothetical protein